MKLLFQSDDYGITDAVTCGILKGIREGVIRNTGLFANMPSTEYAAAQIKDYPQACFGIDINLVAGKPVSDPQVVPGLVDENGDFISSKRRLSENETKQGPMGQEFINDPYNFEETCIEIEAQIQRFIDLVGHAPEYLHGHSLITPNIYKAMKMMSEKYDIPISFEMMQKAKLHSVPSQYAKPFSLEQQYNYDSETNLLKNLEDALDKDKCCYICHAGFVDEDLYDFSSYTVVRQKDLKAATSEKVKQLIKDHHIELITYRDLKGE